MTQYLWSRVSSTENVGIFQRVFLVERVSISLPTSNPVYDQCCSRKYSATMAFYGNNGNPGLQLANFARGSNTQEGPVAEYSLRSIQSDDPNNRIRNSHYYLAQINVRNPSDDCNDIPQEWAYFSTFRHCGDTSSIRRGSFSQRYWTSQHHPVHCRFWFCIVAEAPKVQDNLQIAAQKNFPGSFEVPMVDPLKRIPERITATGLPPGLSLSFNTKPAALLGPDGVYVPESFQPVITGSPTADGVYTANITASNPVGSTTTAVTIQVGPFPSQAITVGLFGASSFHVGADPVSAIHVGDTQIFPYP